MTLMLGLCVYIEKIALMHVASVDWIEIHRNKWILFLKFSERFHLLFSLCFARTCGVGTMGSKSLDDKCRWVLVMFDDEEEEEVYRSSSRTRRSKGLLVGAEGSNLICLLIFPIVFPIPRETNMMLEKCDQPWSWDGSWGTLLAEDMEVRFWFEPRVLDYGSRSCRSWRLDFGHGSPAAKTDETLDCIEQTLKVPDLEPLSCSWSVVVIDGSCGG